MGATQLTDSLRSSIAAAGSPFSRFDQAGSLARAFTPQLSIAAYLSSGMLRKCIDIPAGDRVREWRDWQAESDQITAIEAEERRLQIIAKVRQAEVLRGLGGGALVLALPGVLSTPAQKPGRGQLRAVNVVSRWQLEIRDVVEDMASPDYGMPRMFRINGGTAGQQDIHPSRVICFRGDPLPMGGGMSQSDVFWGASRLERVVGEVEKSDNASRWFAELVKKAKLLRIGIPDLADMVATQGGQQKLDARVATIAMGENTLNATVYSSAAAKDGPGETISDYQVTWNGIPAMMDAFDQRVAAVADIPFTRLMGRSPAGMNATGQHDTDNWNKAVAAGQNLELRPCLEALDAFLIPSAGVSAKVTWRFAPLSTPSEAEEAATFKTFMEAIEKVQASATIPDRAFAEAFQNWMEEREYMPGLAGALKKLPEVERFGISAENDNTDPSALQGGGDPILEGAGGDGSVPARRAANDAKPVPLYVQRKLLNADELIRWAKAQGFKTTLDASDMHVTVLYSRTPVDPIKMGNTWSGNDKGEITVTPGGPRAVEKLGDSAVVLLFACDDLSWRHRSMVEAGASHDYDEYQPHVTLTYDAGDVDLEAIKPFTGALRFGPELFEPLDLDWKSKVTEE
jgi:phage-related protein (TIGR01555 family)